MCCTTYQQRAAPNLSVAVEDGVRFVFFLEVFMDIFVDAEGWQ
jgi:hypothetical protein